MYKCFSRQCSEHVTKEEYDRSHDILSHVLAMPETEVAIGTECLKAVEELQLILRNKEKYLANYRRKGRTMSMQAKTTSPVESMNKVTKHGPKAVNSNMNLSKSIETMADATDSRLTNYDNEARREMGTINRASRAPTSGDVIKQIQHLMDQNWDRRHRRNFDNFVKKSGFAGISQPSSI